MKSVNWKSVAMYCLITLFTANSIMAQTLPLFPAGITENDLGELIMIEKSAMRVAIYSTGGDKLLRSFNLPDSPTGVVYFKDRIYVTTFGKQGALRILQADNGKELSVTVTGSGACAPVMDSSKGSVYVCNQFMNNVSEVDINTGKVTRTVSVLREPRSAILSKDGKYLYVSNFLPAQRADVDYVAACVSVIELDGFTKVKDIQLANGSNALRGICLSKSGKYVYVSHNLGRFTVPTSQLQQGWMNTSAFSVIDTEKQEFLGSIIVDEPESGAAGIWGIACSDQKIYMSHSGTHEVSVIDEQAMIDKFLSYPDKKMLEYDLTFLYGLRKRIALQGNGPRDIYLTENKLVAPTYFADILNFVDVETNEVSSVNLNPNRTESDIHKGEKHFNDASNCFQGWQSCNGCHPGDARTDGMNWDLMNDGVGNSKNCKSLLFTHPTPPSMISGIRENAELAVRAGFKFIQFYEISEEDAVCVDEYLKSLKPVPSPYLIEGKLSEKAEAGKTVFERLKCGECHSGVYYTDCKMHRIGEDIEFEKGWDTPTLCEVWRTAPYLFDGRAATMKEVFEVHKHGIGKKKVSEKEIDTLTEYINSL